MIADVPASPAAELDELQHSLPTKLSTSPPSPSSPGDGRLPSSSFPTLPGPQAGDLAFNNRQVPGATPPTPDVRLYHRAVVIAQEAPLRGLVRQLSIDQLECEGRRVAIMPGERTPLMQRSISTPVSAAVPTDCWQSFPCCPFEGAGCLNITAAGHACCVLLCIICQSGLALALSDRAWLCSAAGYLVKALWPTALC